MNCKVCSNPVGGNGYHKFVRLWEVPDHPIRIRAAFDIVYPDPMEFNITICELCALKSIRTVIDNHISLKEDHDA